MSVKKFSKSIIGYPNLTWSMVRDISTAIDLVERGVFFFKLFSDNSKLDKSLFPRYKHEDVPQTKVIWGC
jgi:hypothetical protein